MVEPDVLPSAHLDVQGRKVMTYPEIETYADTCIIHGIPGMIQVRCTPSTPGTVFSLVQTIVQHALF